MSKFSLTTTPTTLIVKQRSFSFLRDLLIRIVGFLLSLLVFIFPYDQLTAIHKYAYVVYFLPLLLIVPCVNPIRNMLIGFEYILDRKLDSLTFNHRQLDRLSNIVKVEWNIDSSFDHEKSYLELRSKNDQLFRISTTNNQLDNEHLKLGREIAKFLRIQFVNNNPSENEVLWGDFDVDESSIRHIENQMQ